MTSDLATAWTADAIATTLLPGWRTGIAYYRISDDPEHDELGVRRQRKLVRAKAEREQIHLVAEYMDDDRSGYTRKHRPDYEAFLEHAKTVDVALAWHPDRMTRGDLIEIERLIVALGGDEGTPITTCETADYDVATPHGRMIARITGSVARYASEHNARRLQEKMQELAEAGKARGGRRPFGYTVDGQIDKTEARVIRDCVKRVLGGDSIREIAAALNAAGVKTSAGNAWRPGPLKNVLVGTRIVGWSTYKGRVVNTKAEWKPIITEDQHRRVIATLANYTPTGRRGRTPWLLTGLLRCDNCGAALVGNTDSSGIHGGKGTRRYICRKGPGYKGCGALGIKAEPLEDLLGTLVTERLADVESRRDANADRPDDDGEMAELDRIAAKRVEIADDYAADRISREQRIEDLAALERRKTEIETRLAGKVRQTAPLDLVAAEGYVGRPWAGLDITEQRRVLKALIDHVTVAPATTKGSRTFEPGRVTAPGRITWKV